jgi:hypothetical protein
MSGSLPWVGTHICVPARLRERGLTTVVPPRKSAEKHGSEVPFILFKRTGIIPHTAMNAEAIRP